LNRPEGSRRTSTRGLLAVAAAILIAACGAAPPVPGPSASSAAPSGGVSSSGPADVESAPPSHAGATPLPSIDAFDVHLRSITVVCVAGPEEDPNASPPDIEPPDPIDCEDAVTWAVRSLGASHSAPVRAEFRFDANCGALAPCAADTSRGTVYLAFGSGAPLAVPVARDPATADPFVFPAQPLPPAAWPTPLYVPPAVARPNVGNAPPADVSSRPSLPLCGINTDGSPGRTPNANDAAARECFLRAVLSGGSAEYDDAVTSSEGDPIVLIYRYDRQGSVQLFIDGTRDQQGNLRWTHAVCSISAVPAPFFFAQFACDGDLS
jgi:hypothetical protein